MEKTIVLKNDQVLSGQFFTNIEFNTLIRVDGNNVVIEECIINAPKTDFKITIEVNGNDCQIKNCRFSDISKGGDVIHINGNNCLIESCLFYGGLKTSSGKAIVVNGRHNVLFKNRVENWERELDIFVIRGENNTVLNNEFVNYQGTVFCTGKNNKILYNLFDGKDKKKAGGVRIENDQQSIIGNVFLNNKGDGDRCSICVMTGDMEKCYIIYNTFFNCKNGLCLGFGKDKKPKEVYLQANTFVKYETTNSLDKNQIGVEKLMVDCNREDKFDEHKLKYPTIPHEFELSIRENIIKYTNDKVGELKKSIKQLPSIEEEKEDVVMLDDDDKMDVDHVDTEVEMVNVDALLKRMGVLTKVKQFDILKEKIDANMKEYKLLMEEMKKLL